MAKIKNMGTATMRFGEGVIVSGSASQPDGTSSNYAMIISGNVYADESLTLARQLYLSDASPYTVPTIYFNDANSVYIQENNNQMIVEANNYLTFRFDQALIIHAEDESNPIFQYQNKGYAIKGAFFNVSQDSDQNFGISTANSGKTFFVSASDDTVMFHAGGGLPPAPSDTSTWFSGSAYDLSAGFFDPSNFGEATGRITQFSGDVVTSGAIVGKNNSLLGITGEENCLILAAKNSIYSSAGSYGFYSDISNLQNIGNDSYFFVSGAIGGRGQEGTAVFGGDVVTSGSLVVESQASFEDYMIISVSADNTDLQTGTGLVTLRAPFAMDLYQIPRASLSTNGTSLTRLDINVNGITIMNNAAKLTIDANEGTSTTASTAATLTTTSISDDDQITIDVDTAGTGARGLKVTLYYRRTF